MNPKELLYVSDLDGTLLHEDGKIPQPAIERLNRMIDRGLKFTIATARNFDSVRPILNGLDLRFPVILFNGVYLTDFQSGRNFDQSEFISREVVDHLLDVVAPMTLDPFLYTYGETHRVYYRSAGNAGAQAYVESLNGDPRLRKIDRYDIPASERISGFLLIDTHPSLQPVYRSLRQKYPDALNIYFAQDVSMPEYHWLQSFHREASKGRMIRKLAKHLDWSLDCMVVFGDYLNDLDMFEAAGRSIAVSNALPEVKNAADEVIGSNRDDAVIDYLESLGWD
jgi:Cof subfamily protein (haloacid dehalogenase superfamily)